MKLLVMLKKSNFFVIGVKDWAKVYLSIYLFLQTVKWVGSFVLSPEG